MSISAVQRRRFVDAIVSEGDIALAAFAAGMQPSQARALLARDEDLAIEVNDALEIHAGAIYASALQRATTGGSDILLGKLLEARVTGFSKETRRTLSQQGKPSGLILRTFEVGEDGAVKDGTGETIKPADAPKQADPPLQIDYYRGL